MRGEVAVVTRYKNNFILYIISITRIATKKSFKAINISMRYNIYVESCVISTFRIQTLWIARK